MTSRRKRLERFLLWATQVGACACCAGCSAQLPRLLQPAPRPPRLPLLPRPTPCAAGALPCPQPCCAVWVKVVDVSQDERGPKVGCTIKYVSQNDGTDLDPANSKYRPRGEGGGPQVRVGCICRSPPAAALLPNAAVCFGVTCYCCTLLLVSPGISHTQSHACRCHHTLAAAGPPADRGTGGRGARRRRGLGPPEGRRGAGQPLTGWLVWLRAGSRLSTQRALRAGTMCTLHPAGFGS